MFDCVVEVKPKSARYIVSKETIESLTSTPEIFSIDEYVQLKWKVFFGTEVSNDDHQLLVHYLTLFRLTDQTIESAFSFIKNNPKLLEYKKVQVGEGEFALYLLFRDSVRIDKGDLKFNNTRYEVKRIKEANEAIRFGTNVNIETINNFRYVTFGLKRFFNYCSYSKHESVVEIKRMYDEVIGDSDASVSKIKLNDFYAFFSNIYQLAKEPKSLELSQLFLDVKRVVEPFITQYPDANMFGLQVTKELIEMYRNENTQILIIDEKNDFRVNPEMVFHSVNQYVRPQMTLVNNFSVDSNRVVV
jgi:hypothetical protein